jgi:plastocyanin
MMHQRRAYLLAAILTLSLSATACSGDDDGGEAGTSPAATEPSGDAAPGAAAINIADLAFDPSTLTVASGPTDIAITNDDDTDHTFTLDDGSVDQEIEPGGSATVTVDISSSTGFHCTIHPSMTGTLEVA